MGTIDQEGQVTLDQPVALAQDSRVEVIILVPDSIAESSDDEEDALSKEEILSNLKQAWHEAITGQTIPVSQLWNDIEKLTDTKS
ncbi:MAG: hypothetical protein F6K09_18155 [Merismopedia sp. SIO2A8]|nr:hypothetical protein [Merismopedia sp. SIO2A8]